MNAPAPKTSPDTALGNLMAAALDVPAAPEQPAVPDDTLARTGNTADHQAGWFAGMEQGQANAQANMAIRPPSRDWKAIQVAIDDYLDGYELRADEGAHTPTDFERFLLDDCIAGLLAEDDILALLAGAAAPAAGDALDAARYRWLCDKFGITKLPCAIERIIQGSYVADGKAAIDAAIDTAIAAQQGKGGA
ncbi:hypothetical protein L7Q18_01225 [Achromobacter xylosoxidans]|uniref:hypothetical protein n=1 Tax=Alcaligenes xylosoxydans xylosoxydans TaxID=85698 RepID=UPI001F06AFC4|nr:hypothetical protein [Achromobacter xylosoxidans]MCH1984844.1 hypothetical protein [Achromobacter xylosoxidans]